MTVYTYQVCRQFETLKFTANCFRDTHSSTNFILSFNYLHFIISISLSPFHYLRFIISISLSPFHYPHFIISISLSPNNLIFYEWLQFSKEFIGALDFKVLMINFNFIILKVIWNLHVLWFLCSKLAEFAIKLTPNNLLKSNCDCQEI